MSFDLKNTHSKPFFSQTNCFSLCSVHFEKFTDVFVGESGFLHCMRVFHDGVSETVNTSHHLHLPDNSKIIGVTSFKNLADQLIIALTLATEDSHSCIAVDTTLRIYGSRCHSGSSIKSILLDVQVIQLPFMPFSISNFDYGGFTPVVKATKIEFAGPDILVSGSDGNLHTYRQNQKPILEHAWEEVKISSFLHPLPCCNGSDSPLLSICLRRLLIEQETGNSEVVVVLAGFVSGDVTLDIFPLGSTSESILSCSFSCDGPVSSVLLSWPSVLSSQIASISFPISSLGIFASSMTGSSMFWPSVVQNNICLPLPQSHRYDSVLSSTWMDVDLDGKSELLLGTYGGHVLVYSYSAPSASYPENFGFKLVARKTFPHPIHHILSLSNAALQSEASQAAVLAPTGSLFPQVVVLTSHSLELLKMQNEAILIRLAAKLSLSEEVAALEKRVQSLSAAAALHTSVSADEQSLRTVESAQG